MDDPLHAIHQELADWLGQTVILKGIDITYVTTVQTASDNEIPNRTTLTIAGINNRIAPSDVTRLEDLSDEVKEQDIDFDQLAQLLGRKIEITRSTIPPQDDPTIVCSTIFAIKITGTETLLIIDRQHSEIPFEQDDESLYSWRLLS